MNKIYFINYIKELKLKSLNKNFNLCKINDNNLFKLNNKHQLIDHSIWYNLNKDYKGCYLYSNSFIYEESIIIYQNNNITVLWKDLNKNNIPDINEKYSKNFVSTLNYN